MNGSELLVKCLENEGVEYVFGIPGEEMVFFLDALKDSSIQFLTTADERGAAFMAAAYGRLTGKAGVVATTLGPGALNLPNGLAFANLSGYPLVALTWQSGLRGGNKDNGFQHIDIPYVFSPICKNSQNASIPHQIPVLVRNAFRVAQTPKQGVSHIQIFEDIAQDNVDNAVPIPAGSTAKAIVDQGQVDRVVQMIVLSKNPMILAGLRSTGEGIAELLKYLANRTNLPVVTTPMAQGIVSEGLSTSFINGSRSAVNDLVDLSDLVLAVGYEMTEYTPMFWNKGGERTIINLDSVPSLNHSNYNPQIELIGDINYSLSSLVSGLKKLDYKGSKKYKNDRSEEITPGASSFPVKPQYLVSVLSRVAKESIFVHDNGMHKLWMTKYFKHTFPNQVLVDNTLASMGSGIPQAIVSQLLYPEKRVIVNVGDGGFLMSMGELATVARLGLPLIIVVWNDGGYGMIGWHQEKYKLDKFGVSIFNPNFVKVAESFGGIGMRIEKASDIETSIEAVLSDNKFAIIDCPVDYSGNLKEFSNKSKKS